MLEPFAPYLAEEMWEELGRTGPVFKQPWPAYDPELAREPEAEVVIQVNGKVRGRLAVPFGTRSEDFKRRPWLIRKSLRFLEGKARSSR